MKFSIYNSRITLTNKSSLLYNAVTNKYLVFQKILEEFLGSDPISIKGANPDFYSQLEEGGFIIGKDIDEVEKIIAAGKEICNKEDTYRLIINPTTNCNFRCWYCYEKHSPQAKMDGNVVANTIKFIEKIGNSSKIKHLELSFFGGEPLLYYTNTVCPIIDAARDVLQKNNKTYSIHFTSNGYLVNDTVISHLTELDDDVTFQITLDGHREKHNKVRFSASGKGSYDRIIDNIKKLLSNRINVGLRINYTQENIDSIKLILDDLVTIPQEHHKYFNVDFQRVWQEKNVENDDKTLNETIDAFRKVFKNISNYYSHVDAFRHPCYADMTNECVINYNGDVFKCTARDFVPEKRLGVLDDNGDIKWNDTNFVENRLNRKFNKNICKTCRIFPLCGGGCAQNASESPDNVCTKCNGELEKDKIILFRFYNSVVKNSNTTNDKQNV